MILWIASFPRSGNTLLRVLLHQVFLLGSHCKYKSGNTKPNAKWGVVGFCGSPWPKPTWKESYKDLRASQTLCPVRTHDIERDGQKAIYVVRDGRSVLCSYYHFLRDLRGNQKVTLKDVIAGKTGYGSWSNHLSAWNPYSRPDTLVVRYEHLLSQPDEEIRRLEAFMGIQAVASWENRFEEWQEVLPKFFRKGSPLPPVEEYSPAEMKLFWKHHGTWMHRLGYDDRISTQGKSGEN